MLEFIKSRRSTRKFKKEMVDDELINQVVEAGRYAPSGGNNQMCHFLVIKNHDVLTELNEMIKNTFAEMEIKEGMYASIVKSVTVAKSGSYDFNYSSPVLIAVANQLDYGNNMADSACALENMMLMANALDLGSCWINQLRWLNEDEKINKYLMSLGMEDNERVYGALALGYPDTEDGLPFRTPLVRKGNKVTVIE